jgi:hypothetical protein
MGSHRKDRFAGQGHDSSGGRALAYEDKVKLYNKKRYLMPKFPIRTKNWIMRDYIRFIDQYGKWCPEESDHCELF